MTLLPEQVRAKTYLRENGTEAPIARLRERVADAFAALDGLLGLGRKLGEVHRNSLLEV